MKSNLQGDDDLDRECKTGKHDPCCEDLHRMFCWVKGYLTPLCCQGHQYLHFQLVELSVHFPNKPRNICLSKKMPYKGSSKKIILNIHTACTAP